jgi:hypothetical protein
MKQVINVAGRAFLVELALRADFARCSIRRGYLR